MALSYDLISQFAKLVTSDKKTRTESTVYGTVKTDVNGNKYVQLDGSDQLTPLTDTEQPAIDSTSANVNDGERVSVLIKNHTATVTGNISSPAARTGDVERIEDDVSEIKKFDILIGNKVQANEAYFKKLIADDATLGKLTAAEVSIIELLAKKAEIDNLIAEKITVIDLIANKIDADVVIADKALIESLKASNIDVLGLIADKAIIQNLIAENADLNSVEAKNAYLKYATVDFANIGEAAIKKIFVDSGVLEDVTIGEGRITGGLVAVEVSADRIKANTLTVDKVLIRGDDGNYYKINTDFTAMPGVEPVEEDAVHGSAIVAESITAEKMSVSELAAFKATIGGFHIVGADEDTNTIGAIYSGVKMDVDASAPGLYLGQDGQVSLGGKNDYIKFYKVLDEDGNEVLDADGDPICKLDISAESILFGSGSKTSAADLQALTEHVKIGTIVDDETGDEKPCVELSEGDTDFKQVITNVKTMFMDGKTVKTEIDKDGVKTENMSITREFEHGGFIWAVRANGNYGLSWKG